MAKNIDYPKSNMQLRSTTTDTRNLLLIQKMEVTEYGIKFYIEPSPKLRICQPLQSNEMKDLIHSCLIIPQNQDYVFINTAINHPMIYHQKESERRDEDLERLIPKEGEPIAQVIMEVE